MRFRLVNLHHYPLDATVSYQLGTSKAHRGGDVYSTSLDFGVIRSRDGVGFRMGGRAVGVVGFDSNVSGLRTGAPGQAGPLGGVPIRRPVVRANETLRVTHWDDDRSHLVTVALGPLADDPSHVHPNLVPGWTCIRTADNSFFHYSQNPPNSKAQLNQAPCALSNASFSQNVCSFQPSISLAMLLR